METLHVKGEEVTFDDLTKEVQRNLYLKDKEKFQFDAASSQHSEIRKLVVSEETTTSEVLNKVFKTELKIWVNIANIKAIWNHKNFKRTDDKRQALAKSTNTTIRQMVAGYEDSSSEFLNEMLRNEVQNDEFNYLCVVETILDNPKFQMEQGTLKVLAEAEEWNYRLMAAESEDATSELLNEMLRNEVQNGEYQDEDVEKAILGNPNFKMEQETLKVLKEHEYCEYRKMAAECVNASSEFLNEMYRNEIQNLEDDEGVEYAIEINPNFKMEQETLKVLAESNDWKNRLEAVRSKEISTELLESMYQREDNEKVIKAIEDTLMIRNKISKGNLVLNLQQKRMCMGVLVEIREGKDKTKPLAKYLQELLDIIS